MPVKIGGAKPKPEPEFIPLETLAAPKVKNTIHREVELENGSRVLIIFGVRWAEGWAEPRGWCRAYRRMHAGSAIGTVGDRVISNYKGNEDLEMFAKFDDCIFSGNNPKHAAFRDKLLEFGLQPPAAPEQARDFILPWQR